MSISQSVEAPMTTRDTVILSGSLNSHNGVGSGGFVLSGRRLINKGWLEMDVGAGSGPSISLKGSKNLTQRVFCNGGINMNFRPNAIIPGLVGSMYHKLHCKTVWKLLIILCNCSFGSSIKQTHCWISYIHCRNSILNVNGNRTHNRKLSYALQCYNWRTTLLCIC